MFITFVGMLCVVIAVLVIAGFGVFAVYTTKDLALIKERLGYEKTSHKSDNKHDIVNDDVSRGFDSGVNFAFLCMYKMYVDDGMIVGDYDCVSDQLSDTVRHLLKDPAEYQKTYDMLTEYHKDKKDDL